MRARAVYIPGGAARSNHPLLGGNICCHIVRVERMVLCVCDKYCVGNMRLGHDTKNVVAMAFRAPPSRTLSVSELDVARVLYLIQRW